MQENRDEVASGAGGAERLPGRVDKPATPNRRSATRSRATRCVRQRQEVQEVPRRRGVAAVVTTNAQQDGGRLSSSQMSSSATGPNPFGQVEGSSLGVGRVRGALESVSRPTDGSAPLETLDQPPRSDRPMPRRRDVAWTAIQVISRRRGRGRASSSGSRCAVSSVATRPACERIASGAVPDALFVPEPLRAGGDDRVARRRI